MCARPKGLSAYDKRPSLCTGSSIFFHSLAEGSDTYPSRLRSINGRRISLPLQTQWEDGTGRGEGSEEVVELD